MADHVDVARPAHMFIAAFATAMLAVISAGPALAIEADRSDPTDRVAVAVNGTSTLVGESVPGTVSVEGQIVRVRGNVLRTIETATDDRVSGQATITVNIDAYPDIGGVTGATQVRFGSMRLENADGAWTGRFLGSLANGAFVQTYWLEGEAAFEGLSYVVIAGGNGPVWRSQGLIVPGRLPPMGGTARLPIESIDRDLPTAWGTPLR